MIGFSFLLAGSCDDDTTPDPPNQLPEMTTAAVTNITQNSAVSGGTVNDEGEAPVTARGVCWGLAEYPTLADDHTTDGAGIGAFTSNISGLAANTTYYVRAYATNSYGTDYGNLRSFATEEVSLQNGLFSYWKLDENSGTTATDEAGDWDLSFVNAPSWSTSGKINGAIDLGTVSTRHLERTGVSSGNTNTYTLSAWIYLDDDNGDAKNIMGLNSGGTAINAGAAEVKMVLIPEKNLAALYHTADGLSGPMQRISGTTISTDTWYHVAAVFNNGDITLYINGAPDNANAVTNSVNTNLNFANGRVTVGNARLYDGAYIAPRWFSGKIDEAAFWNRALTSEEVEMLYNGGNGLQYPF